MYLIEALEALEAAPRGNARLDKMMLLRAVDGFQQFLVTANDPFITFGVAEIPGEMDARANWSTNSPSWWAGLRGLTDKLATRELSGNAARDAIKTFLASCSPHEDKWARRFLLKDLRLNIGDKEVRKVFGEDALFVFEVPLAKSLDDINEKKWNATTRWVIETKLDGGRCVCIYDGNGVPTLLSRTGKTWGNFKTIETQMLAIGAAYGLKNYVFDGEVVSLDAGGKINFQQIQKTMHRDDGVEIGELQYVAFDGCALDEWKVPKLSYRERYLDLQRRFAAASSQRFRVIEAFEAFGNIAEMKAHARGLVDLGYEGAILREAAALVENKRSKRLLKVKFFIDDEAEIIGVEEGEGRHVGTMGAIICRHSNGQVFKIGSGFVDADRKEFWAESPVGKVANFKYFELTNDGVPRFPIWRSLRARQDIGAK